MKIFTLFFNDLKWSFVILHAIIVGAANFTVQFPFSYAPALLTWAAFVSPLSFFVTDLCNRRHGVGMTRKIVLVSFAIAVAASFITSDIRIAIASGIAFLSSQLLDASIFNRLRRKSWWIAPAISGFAASAMDGMLFFTLAFVGTGLPWINWALADYTVKLTMIWAVLPVYGMIIFGDSQPQTNQ